MNREIIKKKIRDIEISYDYHSYNNTYEVTVDLDTLASLIINIINEIKKFIGIIIYCGYNTIFIYHNLLTTKNQNKCTKTLITRTLRIILKKRWMVNYLQKM